ncbi:MULTISPECIES: DUF2164 domain-containing protein [unclassified Brevundimonas]|uniref:DUF2164 domain-containing protein n=1 Tax=unclassified Brevundimonas TaxID=2622653 RepID=UPI0025C55C77|nr:MULTISPECIES: DUF2164 domain-containing protein [unclassified Brevundimonas]
MANKPLLSPEQRDEAAHKIREWLQSEQDVELGRLPAEMLVEFIEQQVGRHYYNQGLRDAETLIRAKVEDISDGLYGMER